MENKAKMEKKIKELIKKGREIEELYERQCKVEDEMLELIKEYLEDENDKESCFFTVPTEKIATFVNANSNQMFLNDFIKILRERGSFSTEYMEKNYLWF